MAYVTNNRPTLYMLIGLPGSGKSTWLKENRNMDTSSVLSTDTWIETQAVIKAKTYNDVFKEEIKAADNWLKSVLDASLEAKCDIYWDQTNLNKKTRKKKLSKIPSTYRKVAVVFATLPSVIDKVNEDRKQNGRALPEHVLDSMYESFEVPTTDEGFDEIIKIERMK